MDFDITVSANSSDIFQQRENKDLSLLNINWNNELEISITNPYSIDTNKIKIIESPSAIIE